MTGSGINLSGATLLPGMAVAEDENGNLKFPDSITPAMAVITIGAGPKGIVNWTTDGVISLTDWTSAAGTRNLAKGSSYFVGVNGRLLGTGTQQVGVARSGTDLRVSIQPIQVVSSKFWPVNGSPPPGLGDIGDVAYDVTRAVLYGPKRNTGWQDAAYLLHIDMPGNAPVQAYGTLGGLWQWTPRSS